MATIIDKIATDKCYVDVKDFIQKYINAEYLTAETKSKFAEYYDMVSVENCKEIFANVNKLYIDDVLASRRAFNMACMKMSGTVCLIGGLVAATSYICKKSISKNSSWHNFFDGVGLFGVGTLVVGIAMFSAIGH